MSYHALLSPSSAHRWAACQGSTAMEEGEPDSVSEAAAEGTGGHTVGAECIAHGKDADEYIDIVYEIDGYEIEITEDMAADIQLYVDAVRERVEAYKLAGAIRVEVLVEQSIDISFITGEGGAKGTSDLVLLVFWDEQTIALDVWDLKFGRGKHVVAEGNLQCAMYALAVINQWELMYNIREVNVVIHQPRVYREPSEWRTSVIELRTYEEMLRASAQIALAGNGALVPGAEQCQFCKANWKCAAFIGKALGVLGFDESYYDGTSIENIALVIEDFDVTKLTEQQLGEIYPHLGFLELVAKTIREKVHASNLAGNTIPGTKLVKGREGNRKWEDEDKVSYELLSSGLKEDAIYKKKLITVAQTEKSFSKKQPEVWQKVVLFVHRSPAKLTTVPADDPRPAESLDSGVSINDLD